MREGRGRWPINLDTRQQIYNLWIEHSQASTDDRINACKVKFSKMDYINKYTGIGKNMIIEEITNKRGRASYVTNRMISTSTVCSLHHKLAQKGINVSINSVELQALLHYFHISKGNGTMFVQNLFKHKIFV